MWSRWRDSIRVIPAALIALLFTGCTRAIDIPLGDIDAASRNGASHRITMSDGARYDVTRFSTTDSTITIAQLNKADERYDNASLPIVLARDQVKSIERLELDPGRSFFVVAPIGLAVLFVVMLSTGPAWTGSN